MPRRPDTRAAFITDLAKQQHINTGKRTLAPLAAGILSKLHERGAAWLMPALDGKDRTHEQQVLYYATGWFENNITWRDWRDPDELIGIIAPYYIGLQALGYQPSEPEHQALEGAWAK